MSQPALINEPTEIDRYRTHLIGLMSFLHKEHYQQDTTFTSTELSTITPEDVYRYFCSKAYGKENPTISDHPKLRATTIKFWKKSISWFMPNKICKWNGTSGNPTMSTVIANLIRVMKKKESRGEGATSRTDRPFDKAEVEEILSILENSSDKIMKYKYTTMIRLQIHLIGRVDDMAHLKVTGLRENRDHNFTLLCRIQWSKNVLEERDAPNQIIFGAWNKKYCVLLSIAMYLETCIRQGTSLTFLFSESRQSENKVKNNFMDTLVDVVFPDERFEHVKVDDGPIGSHSFRKFAATFARRNGGTKEEVDLRGRWRNMRRANDVYFDLNIPYPDAKIAAMLCVGGGPCKYKLTPDAPVAITDDFLLRNVVPVTAANFSRGFALTLALPLLWAAFDEDMTGIIAPTIKNRIRQALPGVSENPVTKIKIRITGSDSRLQIDEVTSSTLVSAQLVDGYSSGLQNEHFESLSSSLTEIKSDINQKSARTNELITTCSTRIEGHIVSMNRFLRRNSMFAPFRNAAVVSRNETYTQPHGPAEINTELVPTRKRSNDDMNSTPYQSTLCDCPRTLEMLWLEYISGVGGRKPARLLTKEEIRPIKSTYCRRKKVWDRINSLISLHQIDAAEAISRIYQQYGESLTVGKIIQKIVAENK